MELFEGMSEREKSDFKHICNKLLSMCFIIKQNAATKTEYYFILRHREIFSHYLGILGFDMEINEEYGVVQLVNRENFNHMRLKLYESIILLILRILFDEKKRELSLTDVVINIGDIQEKYLSMNIREKQIDKTTMTNALQTMKRFNLVELLDRDLTKEESRIIIYDSILMAVRVDDIRHVDALIEKYRRGGAGDEDASAGQTD